MATFTVAFLLGLLCIAVGALSLVGMLRARFFLVGLVLSALLWVLFVADILFVEAAPVAVWFVAYALLGAGVLVALVLTRTARDAQPTPTSAAVAAPVPIPPARTAPAKPAADLYYDYRGDVHDVIDVEGIGPIYAERMQQVGVYTTARLCYEDPAMLARRLDVPVKMVRKWQAMGELAKVKGIGKQYSEALVRGGVMGIEDLKKKDPKAIAKGVNDHLGSLDVNVLGQSVTPKRVQSWQTQALPMRRVRQRVPTA